MTLRHRYSRSGSPTERAFFDAVESKGLRAALEKIGYRFYEQYWFDRYRLDFVFVAADGRQLDIEVDGKGHQSPRVKQSDAVRDDFLKRYGWSIVRVPASQSYGSVIDQVGDVARNLPTPTKETVANRIIEYAKEVESTNYHPAAIGAMVHDSWKHVAVTSRDIVLRPLWFDHMASSAVTLNTAKKGDVQHCPCLWCGDETLVKCFETVGVGPAIRLFASKHGWYLAIYNRCFSGGGVAYTDNIHIFKTKQRALGKLGSLSGRDFCGCARGYTCIEHTDIDAIVRAI